MKEPLAKAYEPKSFEEKWYAYWNDNGLFGAKVSPGQPKFSLVIPPPNVTGSLHIGHALDETIQDILVRYARMQGLKTLWVPGADHASIATHAKIEEMLANEGTSRWELGREKFMERAWEWKDKYGHIINDQIKALGASCDWTRERFTMDEGCSKAVTEVFVRLFEKGLIYKGNYMVNFCPGCHTVISDIEVEHEEEQGSLWYVRYPLEDSDQYIEVATTRPETIVGDSGVAVSPKDHRYKGMTGKYAILPIVGRRLPIIQDDHVDPAFGTGAVKVTPAHDPDDFEMGRAHNLEFVSVIDTHGKMTAAAGKYQGMDRYECRKAILKDLEEQGYLVKTEAYKHAVGHCHRCDSTVEPLISEQWYVKMKPLAEPALRVVREGEVTFVPERFTKVYLNWMENVHDWCISRQLWWGHRIPAYYCQECGQMTVSREAPAKCPHCGGQVKQDEDVLDTWFSSGLWPFSTLGWPKTTPDLNYFFPTDVLVTGYDIIFFWVARMIFLSLEFTGRSPFHHVVIHGMVRDALGRKMSKSLGNGIDPLDVVAEYGADALRLSLTTGTAMGNDMRLYDEKVEGARNFCNKLWNATRYVLLNLEGWEIPAKPVEPRSASGRWILSRLERTVEAVREALDRFEPGDAIGFITDFIWNEFCDWYIEISKLDLAESDLADEAKAVLWTVLRESLAMLHPFAPFVTEELWEHLPGRPDGPKGSLIVTQYPQAHAHKIDQEAEDEIEALIEATKAIRNMRAEVNIPTGKKARANIAADDPSRWERRLPYIQRLAWAEPLEVAAREAAGKTSQALTGVIKGAEIYLPLTGVIDLDKEIARLEKAMEDLRADIERTGARLQDPTFLEKAPQQIVAAQRKRFDEETDKVTTLESRVLMLKKAKQ